MELIPGMEQIVNHIRGLETKNKELQEENKNLKENLTDYHTMMTKCDAEVEFSFGTQDKKINPKLLDDMEHIPYYIGQITEENEELNKKKGVKWSREFAMPTIEKLREENEQLKEAAACGSAQIKNLKEQLNKKMEVQCDDDDCRFHNDPEDYGEYMANQRD